MSRKGSNPEPPTGVKPKPPASPPSDWKDRAAKEHERALIAEARNIKLQAELAQERERVAELEEALKLAQQACRAVANYPGSMEFLGALIYDRCYDVGRTTDSTGGE